LEIIEISAPTIFVNSQTHRSPRESSSTINKRVSWLNALKTLTCDENFRVGIDSPCLNFYIWQNSQKQALVKLLVATGADLIVAQPKTYS